MHNEAFPPELTRAQNVRDLFLGHVNVSVVPACKSGAQKAGEFAMEEGAEACSSCCSTWLFEIFIGELVR